VSLTHGGVVPTFLFDRRTYGSENLSPMLAPLASHPRTRKAWPVGRILSPVGVKVHREFFAMNGNARVSADLGEGTFAYEGLQDSDIPEMCLALQYVRRHETEWRPANAAR
jgi:hypothetical protein